MVTLGGARRVLGRLLIPLWLAALALLTAGVAGAHARTITWSGYTWDVRPPGFGPPGPNQWSDSEANVKLVGSDLVLAIVKDASGRWTSAEVDNQQHLGYGTYSWVVETDLSSLDSHEVLGMFTYGGSSASNNEIDIEPSHWGNLAWPSGSATVWQNSAAGLNRSRSFEYSNRPPYVNQFTWTPGRIRYLVTDATRAVLFDWTVTQDVPVPSTEVPMTNYWRFEGEPPAGPRSMRLSSFTWQPPGSGPPVSEGAAPVTGQAGGTPSCRVRLQPRRFRLAGRRGGTRIRWSTASRGRLRFVVRRRASGSGIVGRLERAVGEGAGSMRISGRIGGRRLRPGVHRLRVSLASAGGRVRCAPTPLRFRVLGG